MLKILNRLKNEIEGDYHLMTVMHRRKTHEAIYNDKEEDQGDVMMRQYAFGIKCFELESVTNLINMWARFKQMCISELKGTYYDDFEAKWDDEDCPYDPEKDNLYTYFENMFKEREYVMSMELADYILNLDKHSLGFSKLLSAIVPEGAMAVENDNGEMESISNFQGEQHALSSAYSIQNFAEEGYLVCIRKIGAIVKKRGDISKIIAIIDGNNS